MAKKKKKSLTHTLDVRQNLVANEKAIVEDIIKPAVDDHNREMILDLKAKGFDNSRIASRLMIPKATVDKIV